MDKPATGETKGESHGPQRKQSIARCCSRQIQARGCYGEKSESEAQGSEWRGRIHSKRSKQVQDKLREIRAAIRKVAPGATERTDYFQMPGYSYEGKGYDYDGMFAWFSFKEPCIRLHLRPPVIQDHKEELAGCATTKAIVSFPADRAISIALVKKLVQASLRAMKAPK